MPTPKPVSPPAAPSPLAAQIDELGAIDARLAPLRSLIAREETLRKLVRGAYADDARPGEIAVDGVTHRVVLGPRGNQTSIDIAMLVRKIKPSAFARFGVTSLAALKENVSPEVYGAVTASDATGPRALKVFAKVAA